MYFSAACWFMPVILAAWEGKIGRIVVGGHSQKLLKTPPHTCTPMFIAALFTKAKLWKQPRCPTTDE
jgi:hypothetical protein